MPPEVMILEMLRPILGMGLGGAVLFMIYRTVNRALDRRHERTMLGRSGEPAPQLEDLQRRVEVLEDVAFRLQDLEERVDFAERALTRADRRELPPGSGRR